MSIIWFVAKLTLPQVFARKILRIIGHTTAADIDNEARIVTSFLKNGGHPNIVTITRHGWMMSLNYYFIDMELCDLTLNDYISYFAGSTLTFEIVPSLQPAFVENGCGPIVRLHNIWTIGTHISRGLDFMHANGQVHRDLNPRNGTPWTN